jgi:predicted transcriptional regulator
MQLVAATRAGDSVTVRAALPSFDRRRFADTLDAIRASRGLTWRQVADQSGVAASTLTRIQQGKRPDVDGLVRLCHWAGLTDMARWTTGGTR